MSLLWLLAVALPLAAQNGPTASERILEQIEQSRSLERNLRVLCDEIGARLPGTPAMARAVQWGVEAFRQAGADRVHTESFRIANSWQEGESRAELLSPSRFAVRLAALGWSPATPHGGLEADLIDGGSGEENTRYGNEARGRILLVRLPAISTFQEMAVSQRRATIALRAGAKAGAAAVLLMSTRPRGLLYRHTNVVDGKLDKLPAAVVAREDALRLQRLLEAGHKLRLRLELPNKTGGAFEAHNVVAEVRGRDKPDEVVILGAHLDSWDLGTGCLDNGCNAALVVEAARALAAARPRPSRTLRFILFGGEEQGLLGSRAYVEQHRADLDRIVAVLIHDIGVGRISGYSLGGRKEIEPALKDALAPVATRGVNSHTQDALFGTDHFDFLLAGIPTLVANQDTTDYVPNYHAQSDTFDKVDLAELRNQAGIAAVALYNLADRPQRPAKRLSHSEVETLLRETGLDDQMKFLGLR